MRKLAVGFFFGVGVSCRILCSSVGYLCVSGCGSITSAGEGRANLSAIVYLLLCGFCSKRFPLPLVDQLANLHSVTLRFLARLAYFPFNAMSNRLQMSFLYPPQNVVLGGYTVFSLFVIL